MCAEELGELVKASSFLQLSQCHRMLRCSCALSKEAQINTTKSLRISESDIYMNRFECMIIMVEPASHLKPYLCRLFSTLLLLLRRHCNRQFDQQENTL